jgi:hypothetical protein
MNRDFEAWRIIIIDYNNKIFMWVGHLFYISIQVFSMSSILDAMYCFKSPDELDGVNQHATVGINLVSK